MLTFPQVFMIVVKIPNHTLNTNHISKHFMNLKISIKK